ncbi:MAG: sugar ABC transporter permease, partial [Alicyclobacillus shizuokensis]|nr:sugar ABC transporter permease [Alicyclobacillus shizuokensis]
GLFWNSIVNVFVILIIQVPIMIGLAALFATLLNSPRLRLKALFQLGFFLPILIDSVAYSITWSFILNKNGLLNHILGIFGIPPVSWLLSPFWAKVSVMIAMTWHWVGYNVVILLGGMQSIPGEVYEASRVDGASVVRQWFSITLPLLRPILLFETVLSTIGTIQLFTEPYILTGGGPSNATMTPVLYMYKMGFQNFDFGYAAAVAYVVAIIIAILSVVQMRMTRGGEV